MEKALAIFIASILVMVALVSLFMYENYPTLGAQNVIWQVEVQHFITGITAANGKVFVTDQDANVQCYDETSGNRVWETPLNYADYGGGAQVVVYEGKVYASTGGELVKRLNEETGKIEMQYQAPLSGVDDYKFIPSFVVADGKVFAYYSGSQTVVAVYEAATGKQIWTDSWTGLIVNNSTGSLPKSNYAYLVPNGLNIQRLNDNNAEVIWSFPDAASGVPIVYGDQVILWDYAANNSYPQNQHSIVCLNVNTGKELWQANFSAAEFEPTVYKGTLLFAARDGYFYALNMADGSLKWKTNIDPLGLIKNYNQNNNGINYVYIAAGAPLVDSSNNRVFWSIFAGNASNDTNSGSIFCLNLSKGNQEWFTPINNASVSGIGNGGMALLNNQLFVSGNTGLFMLNADSGSIQWERTFYHYVQSPVLAGNEVLVAADLYLIAYK